MPKTFKRRQRRRGDLPAGFQWRDGRPRWVPSPARRKQGWKGLDLKDAWGRWLAKGAAIERAGVVNQAVADWLGGQPLTGDLAAIAPRGAGEVRAAGALGPRAIGVLLDAYFASPDFTKNAARTQSDYHNKLNRFLQVLAGVPPKADDNKALRAGAAKVAQVKALPIDELLPPNFGEPGEPELERAYELLASEAGLPMANGVMACVSAWLAWCVRRKRIWPSNPAELVKRRTLDGRIVVFEWAELKALVHAAEARGLASIADAIILAVDLSWSQQDLLALTWGQVSRDHHVKHRRIKTGNAGNPRLLPGVGEPRVRALRARLAAGGVEPAPSRPLLICELTGQPWAPDTFRHKFADIRAEVAKTFPDVATKQFRDLRDTAITIAYEAGLDIPGICSRSLHAPDHAQAVIGKHYGAIRQDAADAAADRLAAHMAAKGYSFDAPTLALVGKEEG